MGRTASASRPAPENPSLANAETLTLKVGPPPELAAASRLRPRYFPFTRVTERTTGLSNRPNRRKRRIMDTDVLVMGGLTIITVIWAFTRGRDLPFRGFQAGVRLLEDVWLPLLLGFCLAGLFEVMISRDLLVKWMCKESIFQW